MCYVILSISDSHSLNWFFNLSCFSNELRYTYRYSLVNIDRYAQQWPRAMCTSIWAKAANVSYTKHNNKLSRKSRVCKLCLLTFHLQLALELVCNFDTSLAQSFLMSNSACSCAFWLQQMVRNEIGAKVANPSVANSSDLVLRVVEKGHCWLDCVGGLGMRLERKRS